MFDDGSGELKIWQGGTHRSSSTRYTFVGSTLIRSSELKLRASSFLTHYS